MNKLLSFLLLVLLLFVTPVYAQDEETATGGEDIEQMFPELKGDELALDTKHRKLVEGIVDKMKSASSPDEALQAAIALQSVANASDVTFLSGVLKAPKPEHIQVELIRTLGVIGDPRAGDAIRFEIKHGSLPVKLAGIDAMGNLNHSWVVPVLTRHLVNNPEEIIRQRAAASLGKMKSQQAVYALQEARSSSNSTPVKRAIDWAISYAMEQVNEGRIDQKIPAGRKIRRTYKGVVYNVYFPTPNPRIPERPRILVCLHGLDLDYNGVFASCVEKAKERDLTVVAPYFDNIRFPEYGTFNIHGLRSDLFLLEMISHIATITNSEDRQIFMYGHGEGGNMAMRMVMAYPQRIARGAAAVDNFTVLDDKVLFPAGIKPSPFAPDLKIDPNAFLRTDFALLIDRKEKDNWSGKLFYQSANQISSSQGIFPRITRPVVGDFRNFKFSWEMAEKFLFWQF